MWSKDLILNLIVQLKEHENLYNNRHPMYLDRVKRSNSLYKICKALQEIDPDITEHDVKKRIRSLRTQFVRELRILQRSKESSFDGEVSEPKLWCFNELEFLTPFSNTKGFVSNISEVNEGSGSTCEADDTMAESSRVQKSTNDSSINSQRKKMKHQEANHNVLDAFEESGNDLCVLGHGWNSQYAELSSEQKLFARKIISDVLFHGCLDNISEDIVQEVRKVLETNAKKLCDEDTE